MNPASEESEASAPNRTLDKREIVANKDEKTQIQLYKNLSNGIWLPNLNSIKLNKNKGKFIHSMGVASALPPTSENSPNDKNIKYNLLSYNEALYLTEIGNLVVNNQITEFELPMSIQQCYENFLNNSLHLDDYKVFNSLINYGFIVRECLLNSNFNSKIVGSKSNKKNEATNVDYDSDSIIKKSDYGKLTKNQLLEKLNQFVPSIQLKDIKNKILSEGNSSLSSSNRSNKYKMKFDVFLPNKNFKKSQPGEPMFRIATKFKHTEENLYLPKLIDFIDCNDQSPATKNLFAFANESDPIYYSFNCNFSLPNV